MRARHIVTIACVALLILAASAGADELGPPAPAGPEPVAGPAEAPAPTATAAPAAPLAPTGTADSEVTPAPTPPIVQEATPAPTPTAIAEATRTAEAPPAPSVMAAPVRAAAAAAPARTLKMVAQATPTPEPEPATPSGCATPVEDPATGECRVSTAVCSLPLGTDGDDVLTGSPFDDILCGLGGDDRLDGGDGDDVLLGGDGDDVLVGDEGDDCMVGGPGSDRAENTGEESPEVEHSADIDPYGLTEQYAIDITFDAAGRCTGSAGAYIVSGGMVELQRPREPGSEPAATAPAGAAPVAGAAAVLASSSSSDGLRLALPEGRLAVRRGVVRVPVSCSAVAPAELVLVAGSRRIAHKRFTCTPPDETVRVRLNEAGRRLVARERRPEARLLVLARGGTVSRQVLLLSPGG